MENLVNKQREGDPESNADNSVVDTHDRSPSVTVKSEMSTSSESDGKGGKQRLSKRALRIEAKIKQAAERSLFDTDGDLSAHNILEPAASPALSTRNSRKRKLGVEEDKSENEQPAKTPERKSKRGATHTNAIEPSRKRTTENKLTEQLQSKMTKKRRKPHEEEIKLPESARKAQRGRGLQKLSTASRHVETQRGKQKEAVTNIPRSTETLLKSPKTPLDKLRNEWLSERETKLQDILTHHDAAVRELYHLEVYQNMLEYNPDLMAQSSDERLLKVNGQASIFHVVTRLNM